MERLSAKAVGETTLTGKNQVSLPVQGLRELGWEKGDSLLVEVLNHDVMLLMRRPKSWTETFAGQLGYVFGTHDDTLRWIDDERRSWDQEEPEHGDEPA